MEKINTKLTVYFEPPYWIGIYERVYKEKLMVSKTIFGKEPKDYEIYKYFMENWKYLKFSDGIENHIEKERKINPKRMIRIINSEIEPKGIGTKSQEELKKQYEENKLKKKDINKIRKIEKNNEKYEKRKLKRKNKKRGK